MTLGAQEWKDHAALVGAVTLSWNRNVHQLLRVFIHLTGIESPVADAIFFNSRSDSAQRQLIKQLSKVVGLAKADEVNLSELLQDLQGASTARNLATHIIFGVTAYDPITGIWGAKVVPTLTPRQDARLQDDFTSQFMEVEKKLASIYQELENWLVRTPYPQRPWGNPSMPLAANAEAERLSAAVDFFDNDLSF